MLISSSCVRELPCDLLLSSTVLQKKKKSGLKRSENRLAVSRNHPDRGHCVQAAQRVRKRSEKTTADSRKKENYP